MKPANLRKDRKDRRFKVNQSGKRRCVVVVREREGKTTPQVFKTEAEAAHGNAASKYTASFLELAKGSHAESQDMFRRLAESMGIDFDAVPIVTGEYAGEEEAAFQKSSTALKPGIKREVSRFSSQKLILADVSSHCISAVTSIELIRGLREEIRR